MMMAKVSEQNLKALRAVKEIIEVEEGREITIDQALSRMINFYRRFVPIQVK